jgi:hypothetical protein
MVRTRLHVLAILAAVAVLGLLPARLHAQAKDQSLGSVTLSKKVMANGQPLAAGTYTVRLASDSVSSVVGQSPDSEKWVEFVQGGQVKGKELATVVTGADSKTVLKGKAPAAGSARVDMLKGADYVRVWINKGGSTYLIHLTLATS